MRIIAGTAGGIHLKVPPLVARPTADRVREALFSMLGTCVKGARVLDLFAGSGALGLECLSRGAQSATFVEQNGQAASLIQDNLRHARLAGGTITKAEAFAALRRMQGTTAPFDLIFADPPYTKKPGDTDFAGQLLADPHLRSLLKPDGLLVLETMVTKRDSSIIPDWEVVRDRAYGSTRILLLKLPTLPDGANSGAADLQSDLPGDTSGDAPGSPQKDEGPGREDA